MAGPMKTITARGKRRGLISFDPRHRWGLPLAFQNFAGNPRQLCFQLFCLNVIVYWPPQPAGKAVT